MLDKCIRDQWSIDDLDWSIPPPRMSRDKEEAICQAFVDMGLSKAFADPAFARAMQSLEFRAALKQSGLASALNSPAFAAAMQRALR